MQAPRSSRSNAPARAIRGALCRRSRKKTGSKKPPASWLITAIKKSLGLNLRDPKGQDIFRKLAIASDVVVENLRPGSMSKLGLGHKDMRALKPELVWAIISGFGRMDGFRGPYSDRPAFDIVAEGMSGIMNVVGFADKPPSWTIYGMADIYSGLTTAFGITQALFMRERTGQGQVVDSAMYDNMLSLNEQMVALYSVAGQTPERGVAKNLFPRGAFQTKDGYIALNIPDNIMWKRFCEVMGRADLVDDERANTGTARSTHADFLTPIIEDWLSSLSRDDAVEILNASGVPCGPINTAEDVFADPHVKARGMLMDIDDAEVGTHQFARTTPFLETNAEPRREAAPALGQHTREILEGLLDYSPGNVDDLVAEGVLQTDD